MMKLAKLPDRKPVKLTVTVNADLNRKLRDYAALYRETYGESEAVDELIPFMLEAFLENDRVFVRARKEGIAGTAQEGRQSKSS
ncbi:transposase [Thalassospira xiamenensis]|uniref:Transposase n=2 Tax=Thalassospira xiamenensis TaxID=220697 RepID=A0ABR5XYT4_9PROT|nr:transposase [Thalassospira xiamenensis]KZD03877.1 transposase [Thalassospira xiamenensis]